MKLLNLESLFKEINTIYHSQYNYNSFVHLKITYPEHCISPCRQMSDSPKNWVIQIESYTNSKIISS